jgi:hypothetical protein
MRTRERLKGPADAPKLAEDTISAVLESIVELYRKISASVVLCGTLLVLTKGLVDGYDLWGTAGAGDVHVFLGDVGRRHVGGATVLTREKERFNRQSDRRPV